MNTENCNSNDLEACFAQCRKFANHMAEKAAPLVMLIGNIQEMLKPFLSKVNEFAKQNPNFFEQLLQFAKGFQELPTQTKEALLTLGNHGWFFDSEMWTTAELWNLKDMFSAGNVEAAQNILIKYFRERLDAIENSIIGKFPNRAKIIKRAFGAHRKGECELSVPVLLAQADGICKEVIGKDFFVSKNRKNSTAVFVEQIASDIFMAALLQPLASPLPINLPERKRNEIKQFNELNRHTVLHGESLDYGTEINSLKAISLINYLSSILPMSVTEHKPLRVES